MNLRGSSVIGWLKRMRQEFSAFLRSQLTAYIVREGVFSTEQVHCGVIQVDYAPMPRPLKPVRSLMTSPAMMSPTTDGTKALLPGT